MNYYSIDVKIYMYTKGYQFEIIIYIYEVELTTIKKIKSINIYDN